MAQYKRSDARAWAHEHLKGCSGVTIPSYSGDLKRLNERGIRHDIELLMKLGFSHTLLCTEVAITPEENLQFTQWARETAGGGPRFRFRSADAHSAGKLVRSREGAHPPFRSTLAGKPA